MPRAGIGQPVRRHEDARLLTGRGRFGDDLSLPGQAVAWILRSPHAHAELAAIETAAASAAPGVVAVLTGAEYLADGNRAMPHAPASRSPPDITLANTDGSSIAVPDQMPLAIGRVRFVGEAIALIVAETLAAAKDAAELVVVDYRPLPAVTAAVAAAAPDARQLWGTSNVVIDAMVGDGPATEAAFGEAAHIARLETHVQRVTGVPMERRTALAEFDTGTGRYTLYAGGGGVGRPKHDGARMLGVEDTQIRIVAYDVGGYYGARTIDDVGRAVNPMIIDGQTYGGIAQGMGQALMEHCIDDPESGQPLAGSFMDYAMPRAGDLPFFATDISEVPSTTHLLGFRGGGEGGITPSLGVIVNAIVDALAEFGVTHVEMPATAEKVWRAMRAGRTPGAGATAPTVQRGPVPAES